MYIADAIYLVLKGYDNIDKISLRNNSLKKCPKKIFDRFPSTTIFNIEGNEVAEIPDELAVWTSLKGFNAANNQITNLPDSIYALEQLLILDLSGNQIVEIDVERLYGCCTKLVKLNLTNNPLSDEVRAQLENSSKKPTNLRLII